MKFNGIDRANPLPLHEQISLMFRSYISSGEWPSHYRLKPEPALAEQLGVSRGTLRRAIKTLVEEGLLTHTPGRGTFVTSPAFEPELTGKLRTLGEGFAAEGIRWFTTVEESQVVAAPSAIAALLEVSVGGSLFRLVRTGLTDVGPVAYLVNYVRTDIAAGIEQVDFSRATLFDTLEHSFHLQIGSGRRTFSAMSAPAHIARRVNLAEGDPMLHMEQITYLEDSTPVEYSDVWLNSTKLRISSVMSRR